MPSPRWFLASALLAAAPLTAAAQGTVDLGGEIFWAHTTSLPGSPGLGGFGVTLSSGGLGVRGSGAFSQRYDDQGDAADIPWTVDADLFITSAAFGRVLGIALGGFMPVGFVGIGRQGIREPGAVTSSVTTISYGGGASMPLFAGLRLSAELRQRRALAGSGRDYPTSTGMGTGREIRVILGFGGRGASRSSRRPSGGGGVILSGPRSSANASASARRVIATG